MQPEAALYVVATPIGNLGDLSARARDVLDAADVIAAEDTRVCRKLLSHLGIRTAVESCHDFNESQRAPALLQRVRDGEIVALVADAGTPLISDPGFALVRMARDEGIAVVPVPGPCAATTALSVAGLPCSRFAFEGFLPAKSGARRHALERLRDESRTLVFYESPRRVVACLEDMAAVFGETRQAAVARELTKKFESVRRDSLAALREWVVADPDRQRGEFVLIVEGAPEEAAAGLGEARRLLELLLEELPPARAAQVTAHFTGCHKREVYALVDEIRR